MSRRYSRDANSQPIIDALTDIGCSVLSLERAPAKGVPDLLVGGVHRVTGRKVNVLIEIKTDAGSLSADQVEWHAAWRGQVAVARTPEEALAVMGVES